MGISKTALFTEAQNELASVAKAIAHPARVAILHILLTENRCINSDLVKELGLAQATISQHLRELKDSGLIQGTIEGASMSYCIHPENWKKVEALFDGLFGQFTPCSDSCC
jgi:predicted transcriptional regulator